MAEVGALPLGSVAVPATVNVPLALALLSSFKSFTPKV